eukprot:TRINITY_DN9547_c0_g1_i1.p1 TRINITY_DN9547_c0_g1~~TRINITY_DN9547_c0_g1_i1.p1  ORF type:complete len:344 (+),score=59.65 TRINITY_DN9547_c0_g1_i1:163-1194(+)
MAGKRNIVVAVDDSETSAYSFTWAIHHFIRKTDHVVVLNAAPYSGAETLPSVDVALEYGIPVAPPIVDTELAEKTIIKESTVLVMKFLNQLKQAGISSEGEVLKGDPASWIVDECKRLHADVVIVGSHGYGVIKRTVLGSISDYVLHNVECPVIIVRQSDDLQHHDPLSSAGSSRKIVIPVDDSESAIHAFKWALENVCQEKDKVIIYHVQEPIQSPVTAGTGNFGGEEVYLPPDFTGKDEVEALNESEKLVEKFMIYVSNATNISCEGMVVPGPTEPKVCAGLKILNADAVVVGSHDRGAMARTFLGSVGDYLAHNSPCPVIVVKMSKADQQPTLVDHEHDT